MLLNLAVADLEQTINQLGFKTVGISVVILVFCTLLAIFFKKHKKLKLPLFLTMAVTLVLSTLILFVSTIYLNVKSDSKGPVHWHSDIEFWACGVELDLRDPHGVLSNKIGTSTFHEHNDKRIHLEGVVVRKNIDAGLSKFMNVTGGYITTQSLAVPLNDSADKWFAGIEQMDGDKQKTENIGQVEGFVKQNGEGYYAEFKNGEQCDSAPAELQTFVISFNKQAKTYSQIKLANPTRYTMRGEPLVPPGDCVIVEFDTPKTRTDKLCRQYGIRDEQRCEEFGAKSYSAELCNIREVTESIGPF